MNKINPYVEISNRELNPYKEIPYSELKLHKELYEKIRLQQDYKTDNDPKEKSIFGNSFDKAFKSKVRLPKDGVLWRKSIYEIECPYDKVTHKDYIKRQTKYNKKSKSKLLIK